MTPSAQSPANKKTKLRREIVKGAFFIPFALLVALGAITFFLARSTTTDQALRSLETVATIQKDRVEAYIESGQTSFALITARTRLREAIADYERTRDPVRRADAVRILYDGVIATPDLDSVTVYNVDLSPIMFAGTVESQPPVPYDYLLSSSTKPTTGLVVTAEGGEMVNLVGGPIYDGNRVIAVAIAGQSLDDLVELTSDTTGLGNTGELILAQNRDGQSEPFTPLRFEMETSGEPAVSVQGTDLLARAISGTEMMSTGAKDYHGETAFAYSRHIEDAGWGLVVMQDISEILAPVNIYTQVLGVAILIGILIAWMAATRVATAITKPIVQVAEQARKVASGRRDLTVETELEEIAFLVDSFNTMVCEIDELTGDLERKIDERTQELTEKNVQLKRVMDDKEVFLAGVSHELRSPLTAMIGFIDLVTESGDDLSHEERSEMLETISFQATDVLNLIEDLLASARAVAGTLKVAQVRVNLPAQVRQVMETVNPSSRSELTFVGGDGAALGDPARVRQIVRNLVTNAFRYGGPHVEIEVKVNGDVAVLEVRDDGDGVPEADRETIFEPYGQSDSSRQVSGSVGLGLHVSRDLARLMGGDLDYEYQGGKSVFSLRLLRFVEEEAGQDDGTPIVVSIAGE